MPGSLVRDSLAANLLAGSTLNAAGTTNGTVTVIDKPGEVRLELALSTVTGTTPTISVELKGADDLAFTVNVVSFGVFSTTAGGSQSNIFRYMAANINKQYVRSTVIVAGTSPVYTGATLKARTEWDRASWLSDSA